MISILFSDIDMTKVQTVYSLLTLGDGESILEIIVPGRPLRRVRNVSQKKVALFKKNMRYIGSWMYVRKQKKTPALVVRTGVVYQ